MLTAQDYAVYDSYLAARLRVLLRGKATKRTLSIAADGSTVQLCRTSSNLELFRKAAVAPSHVEATIARCKFMQQMSRCYPISTSTSCL